MKKYWPALLSGIFMGTTFVPFPPWASFFCYVPLWLFLLRKETSLKEAFWSGWITQFVLSLIGFHWIYELSQEFGHLPWFVSLAALLGFAALVHTYIAFGCLLGVYLKQRFELKTPFFLLAMALIFSLFERVWPSIFPWHLGYTLLWGKLPISQLGDLIGFLGLSTFCLLTQSALALLFVYRRDYKKPIWIKSLLLVLLLHGGLNFWGYVRKSQYESTDKTLNALVVQANIGNFEKIQAEKGRGFQYSVIDDHLDLIRQFKESSPQEFEQIQLMIWPETAFPDFLDDQFLGFSRPSYLAQALKNFQKPLLTGAYSRDQKIAPEKSIDYNALFLLNNEGKSLSPAYRKTHLLIFGEHLPLSETFPILLEWFPFIANFGRGPGPSLLTFPLMNSEGSAENIQFGAQICYEGLYPKFSRGLSLKGAQILVNVTNDSWFGKLFEPYQHMSMTLARAIEVRLPLIRSTNTGISTAILASGEILQQSPLHQSWVGHFKIPYKSQPSTTFYVQWGHYDWIIWLALLLGIIFASWKQRKI